MSATRNYDTPPIGRTMMRIYGLVFSLVFIFVYFMLGYSRYPRTLQWSFVAVSAVALAGFMCRRSRGERWFWPAIAGVTAVQLLAVLVQGEDWLPVLGVLSLIAVVVDGLVMVAALGWIEWLSARRTPFRAATGSLGIIAAHVAALLVIFGVGCAWYAQTAIAKSQKLVLARSTSVPRDRLRYCLYPPHHDIDWTDLPGTASSIHGYDLWREIGVTIAGDEVHSDLFITSAHGRALTAEETRWIDGCD